MKRKRSSASFKAKVALEAIRGLKTTNELAAEFGVHTTQIGHWKKQALGSLPDVFANHRGRSRDEDAALKFLEIKVSFQQSAYPGAKAASK